MDNLVAVESVVKCLRSFKVFSKGKQYKIKGFGSTKINRPFWIFMSLHDNNIEFKVFKDTANRLVEDGVLKNL
tara:strand:- start:1417 stop:1635 length:219 start_codon:yes stop_codon:yes gene_type:complete